MCYPVYCKPAEEMQKELPSVLEKANAQNWAHTTDPFETRDALYLARDAAVLRRALDDDLTAAEKDLRLASRVIHDVNTSGANLRGYIERGLVLGDNSKRYQPEPRRHRITRQFNAATQPARLPNDWKSPPARAFAPPQITRCAPRQCCARLAKWLRVT